MEVETNLDSKENTQVIDVEEYPYSQLFYLKISDYYGMGDAIRSLKCIVAVKRFYDNPNGCLDTTLDFILTYSTVLIKNQDNGCVLSSFLQLLTDIISRINCFDIEFSRNKGNRIVLFIRDMMNSTQQSYVKVEGGKLLMEVLKRDYKDSEMAYQLGLQVITTFESASLISELSQLLCIFLKGKYPLENNMENIVTWMTEEGAAYLVKADDIEILVNIQNLFLTYLDFYQENSDKVVNSIVPYLADICQFIGINSLRKVSEKLLSVIIEKFYCNNVIVWPGGRLAILHEILNLPDDFTEWPTSKSHMFFIVAYLLFSHSRILWSNTEIKKCIDHYCFFLHSENISLKAIAYLYPVVTCPGEMKQSYDTCNAIVRALTNCKFFSYVLTYSGMQIAWFVKNVSNNLQFAILKHWLLFEKDDDVILNILTEYHIEPAFIKLLASALCSTLMSRVMMLIKKIKPKPHLQRVLQITLLAKCDNEKIRSLLLEMDLDVPEKLIVKRDMLKMIVVNLPLLNESVVANACYYGTRLLKALNYHPHSVNIFIRFPITVKYLAEKCLIDDEKQAIASINLLKELIKNQTCCQVYSNNIVEIQFTKLLTGSESKILSVLDFIQQALMCNNELDVLVSYCQNETLTMYYLIHTFTSIPGLASQAFITLKLFLQNYSNLAFSLATPQMVTIMCRMGPTQNCLKSFLSFVEEWLKIIISIPYVQIPTRNLETFLNWIPRAEEYHDYSRKISRLLQSYESLKAM